MDGYQLDAFARRFALSRREALRALAGAMAGGLLGLAGQTPAAAKRTPRGCKQFCEDAGLTKKAKAQCHRDCAQGGTGLYAQCEGDPTLVCQTPAGPVCPDLATDPAHCGACGNACGGLTCQQGQCQPACDDDPFRICENAAGPFCCPLGQTCHMGECFPCDQGVVSVCVELGTCTAIGGVEQGGPCDSPGQEGLISCAAAGCEYWEAGYICIAGNGFPGRVACCTPGVDCPACNTHTGSDDPHYVPCPNGPIACSGAPGCLPPKQ